MIGYLKDLMKFKEKIFNLLNHNFVISQDKSYYGDLIRIIN